MSSVYCARGWMETLIKDMKLYTRSGKTACLLWRASGQHFGELDRIAERIGEEGPASD